MALEALREKVGNAAFYGILRDWVTRHRLRQRHHPAVHRLAEADSGHDLNNFFHVWLYGRQASAASRGATSRPGHPMGAAR